MDILQALELMLDESEAVGRSLATLKTYRSIVGGFASHTDKTLKDVARQDIIDWMHGLRSRKAYTDAPQKPEADKYLSPHTVATYDRHLRAFFNWCVDAGHLQSSPMKGMKKPRPPRLQPKAVTPHQLVKILTAAKAYPDSVQAARNVALVAALSDSGARVSGMLSLTVSDFLENNRRATVLEKGIEREIYFTSFTAQLIKQWLSVRESHTDFVWTSVTTGEQLTGSGVDQMLKRLKHRAGVRGQISAHRFRHGFAVAFVKAGGDVTVLKNLLGHESITTTDSFYSIFSKDELKLIHDDIDPLSRMLEEANQ